VRKTGEKKTFGGGREQWREPESHDDGKSCKEDGSQRREEEVAKEKIGEVAKSKT